MPLPDFLIVGAMKCGTSTLHAQLEAQPGVFMSTPKEPNYFSDDDIFAKGADWYESLFEGAAAGDLKGESSTHYTKLPTHPHTIERIAAAIPAPKIIYMIRDPLERALSHYLHEWTQGVVGNDPVRAFQQHPEFTSYSCYALQIAPYIAAFGKESILLLRTEDMKADPQQTLDRVAAFLGREGFEWQSSFASENKSSDRSRRLPFHDVIVDSPVATTLRRALVPKAVRTWIRDARAPKGRPELPADMIAELQATFAEDHAELQRLFPSEAQG